MGNRETGSLILRSDSLMTKIMSDDEPKIIEHIEGEKIDCESSINQVPGSACR